MSTTRKTAPWVTVMKRELVVRALNKGFIIGTLVSMLVMIGAGLAIYFLSSNSADRIAVTDDHSAAVVAIMNQGSDEPAYEAVRVDSVDEAERLLSEEDVDAVLAHADDSWTYVVREFSSDTLTEQLQISQVVTNYMIAQNSAAQGIDFGSLSEGSTLETRALDGGSNDTAMIAFFMSLAFSLLFLSTALGYGMQIAQSVVEEKQSRIVEILISAIPVRHLLAGKIIGNTIVAFSQLVLYAGIGLIGLAFTDLAMGLPGLGSAIAWFIVFFMLGFIALSCIWAAAGAMATRQEDLGNTTMPLMLVLMMAYVAGFVATGTVRTVLSFVPILSSTLMPARLMTGDASWVEAAIALAITAAFCFVAILFGERVYRRGVLQTKVMGVKELVAGMKA